MRKRKNREEKKEMKDKEQAKKAAQQILDRINKIEKKMEKLMELEKQFKQISNHIVYLHETSPAQSVSHVASTNQKHVRRKSFWLLLLTQFILYYEFLFLKRHTTYVHNN